MRRRKSGGVSEEDELRRKKDFSNHFSALLLSPELSFPPRACKLEGEWVAPESPPELDLCKALSRGEAFVCLLSRDGCGL